MTLANILKNPAYQFALILGNGINRYNNNASINSWDAMLLELWERHTQEDAQFGIWHINGLQRYSRKSFCAGC